MGQTQSAGRKSMKEGNYRRIGKGKRENKHKENKEYRGKRVRGKVGERGVRIPEGHIGHNTEYKIKRIRREIQGRIDGRRARGKWKKKGEMIEKISKETS